MAIKGLAYPKTTWAFEERPVASSKLNTWDDRIEAGLELAFDLVRETLGGRDGVVRTGGGALRAQAAAAPGLSVEVQPGAAFIGGFPYRQETPVQTVDVTPPVSEDRLDLVQACLDDWTVTVKTGAEGTPPVEPAADTDCLALAALYLRPGMTTIKNTDDGSEGYIIDVRKFL